MVNTILYYVPADEPRYCNVKAHCQTQEMCPVPSQTDLKN